MGAILRSNKTSDASSSVLAKCNQRSKPCDKCELIDERTIPSSLTRTTRTESSKCATIKGHSPQSLSNGTSRECSDHVPLNLTSVGDRTKGELSVCDDKIKSDVDERKNLDTPFLNKSLERIREFFKGEAKPTQENGEVSKCVGSVTVSSLIVVAVVVVDSVSLSWAKVTTRAPEVQFRCNSIQFTDSLTVRSYKYFYFVKVIVFFNTA
jgi:hypothetical protein